MRSWVEVSRTRIRENYRAVRSIVHGAAEVMPVVKALQAVWSPEQSAFFVKCQMTGVKKMNLAVRNDNPAGRWQVDGGF